MAFCRGVWCCFSEECQVLKRRFLLSFFSSVFILSCMLSVLGGAFGYSSVFVYIFLALAIFSSLLLAYIFFVVPTYRGVVTNLEKIRLPLRKERELPSCPFVREYGHILGIKSFIWDCRVNRKVAEGSSISYGDGFRDQRYNIFVEEATSGYTQEHKQNYRYLLGIAELIDHPKISEERKIAAIEILMDSMQYCNLGKMEGLNKAYSVLVSSLEEDVEQSIFFHIAKLKEILITEPWKYQVDHVEYWNAARSSLLCKEWGLPPLPLDIKLNILLDNKGLQRMRKSLKRTFCDVFRFIRAIQALINEEMAISYHSKYHDFLVKIIRKSELKEGQTAEDFVAENFYCSEGTEILGSGVARILSALNLLLERKDSSLLCCSSEEILRS